MAGSCRRMRWIINSLPGYGTPKVKIWRYESQFGGMSPIDTIAIELLNMGVTGGLVNPSAFLICHKDTSCAHCSN